MNVAPELGIGTAPSPSLRSLFGGSDTILRGLERAFGIPRRDALSQPPASEG